MASPGSSWQADRELRSLRRQLTWEVPTRRSAWHSVGAVPRPEPTGEIIEATRYPVKGTVFLVCSSRGWRASDSELERALEEGQRPLGVLGVRPSGSSGLGLKGRNSPGFGSDAPV